MHCILKYSIYPRIIGLGALLFATACLYQPHELPSWLKCIALLITGTCSVPLSVALLPLLSKHAAIRNLLLKCGFPPYVSVTLYDAACVGGKCEICGERYKSGDRVSEMTDCGHLYHEGCLEAWTAWLDKQAGRKRHHAEQCEAKRRKRQFFWVL